VPSPLPASPPRPWRPDVGRGVFETILVLDGRPVELDAHLARLEASLGELYPGRPTPNLTDLIQARAKGFKLGIARTGVEAANGTFLSRASASSLLPAGHLLAEDEDRRPRATGLGALVLTGGLGPHKWTDRGLLDEAQADLPADTIPLVIDADGAVLEASRASVFAVSDGVLRTPPLDGRILPGITRARVLELAAARRIETHETPLSRDDLLTADEVFLTGSVRGVEPAGALDGTPLGPPGPVASGLAADLRQAWLSAVVG
jgi:para-aminobenzoate synthetase/4-amino-4-deoxychorismate lyase